MKRAILMYSDPEGKKTLETEDDSCLPLAVLFKQEDGQWILSSVTCPGPEEELVPGWGIGTDGINGISDEMFLMMDEGNHFEWNKEYMNRYLEHNHPENAEVNWGR